MKRRRFIATAAAGVPLLATAGCVGQSPGNGGDGGDGADDGGDGAGAGTDDRTTDTTAAANTDTPVGGAAGGDGDLAAIMNADLPVEDTDLTVGAPKDGIPAIVDPAFGADWSGTDYSLDDDDRVIGVARNGEARAYPLAILNWHEVVNDTFGDPLLVTFCPLCGSGIVAERTLGGEAATFGVSGYLWHTDLVMYDDKTDSLWSQILAKAIQGSLTGSTLPLLPSTLSTWGEWRDAHPDTEVLLPPPDSSTVKGREVSRSYDRDPYAGYAESEQIGISGGEADDRLHPKANVIGVSDGDAAVAYPFQAVQKEDGLVSDRVGGVPVAVATLGDGTLVAYDRRVDGETLTVERDGDHLVAGGSRWQLLTGRAVDGPHEGTRLERANDRSPMFWFAWADFFPDTDIYGQG